MPIPVTTTRLITASSASGRALIAARPASRPARLHCLVETEQADLKVVGPIDDRSVGLEPAVGYSKHELGAHHALDVDPVDDLPDIGKHLAGEFQFAEPKRTAFAGRAEPAQEEAEHLPQRIDAEAAGHDRIALEVAGKETEGRLEGEHRADHALAVFPTPLGDLRDAVEHQHRRQRQLRALVEQLAPAASQKVFVLEAIAPALHPRPVLSAGLLPRFPGDRPESP